MRTLVRELVPRLQGFAAFSSAGVTDAFRWYFDRALGIVLSEPIFSVSWKARRIIPGISSWRATASPDSCRPRRAKYRTSGAGLYEPMYASAAKELGYEPDEVEKFVKVMIKRAATSLEPCVMTATARSLPTYSRRCRDATSNFRRRPPCPGKVNYPKHAVPESDTVAN
jgi:hypothetical protein